MFRRRTRLSHKLKKMPRKLSGPPKLDLFKYSIFKFLKFLFNFSKITFNFLQKIILFINSLRNNNSRTLILNHQNKLKNL